MSMMIKQQVRTALFLFLILLIVGCRTDSSNDEMRGRITVWHSWPEEEAVALEEVVDQFEEIYPGVRIVLVALPEDRILGEFIKSGNAGLGPALLIGHDSWIGELANAGLIRPLNPEGNKLPLLNTRNRGLTEYQDQIFGIPLSLMPSALYYNKNLVTTPPQTVDELLQEAAAGNQVAFVPRFEEAYWGIQAFGEGLFDADNHFTLSESGFTEWLTWLDEAQRAPGVILNVDDESLLELFTSGQIAYYVAGPEKQKLISSKISEENPFEFGVVPLPRGPLGNAGPLLSAETILHYAFTSPEQTRIADALAIFLVNQQQSIRFMRELKRVPANPAVTADRRIYPIVSGFVQQARMAAVIPNEIASDSLVTAGDRAYISVLSGALTPAEAVCRFGRDVATFQQYTTAEVSLPEGCEIVTE